MSSYRISPAAARDLAQIRSYLLHRAGRSVAGRVLRRLRDGMRRIAEMPGIGHLRTDLAPESLRFYRVYQYLIIYRRESSPIEIVRVLHGARDVRTILESS